MTGNGILNFHLNCIFRITRGADFGLLTHPGLLLQEESARPEDFTTTCHLRFQQTEVEVYAHFRVPDDNRNQFLVHKKVNLNFHCDHFMTKRKYVLVTFYVLSLCSLLSPKHEKVKKLFWQRVHSHENIFLLCNEIRFQAQIRVTDLVKDKLRIADTSIATLSSNIVEGVSPGRTEVQVRW